MPKAKKTFQGSHVKPLEDSGNSSKSSNPTAVLDQPLPPTPSTNRRILHDVATIANIPDHLNSFRLSLITAETMKPGESGTGGAFIGEKGVHLMGGGGKPPEIDEIDPEVVKKATKEWIERELSEEQVKLVDSAGVLTAAAAVAEGNGKENVQEVLQLQDRGNWNKDGRSTSIDRVVTGGSSKGKKRIRDEAEKDNPEMQQDQEVQIDWDEEIDYPWDCDEIRHKIRTFIENGGMKVTAFQRTIRTNSNSYGRFMKLRGLWSGQDNNTFDGATRFFKAREAANLPMPKKPKIISSSSSKSTKTSYNYNHLDISSIYLDGEDTDSVPVFDSCDEIRRKISAHLRKPGVTQAQFLRDISAQVHTPPQPVSIQGQQLMHFRNKSGSLAGNTSRVYYGAYVYFENCRIKEGKKKSKHRLEMEKRWKHQGGVNIERVWGRVRIRQGEVPTWDQYGSLHILGRQPRHKR